MLYGVMRMAEGDNPLRVGLPPHPPGFHMGQLDRMAPAREARIAPHPGVPCLRAVNARPFLRRPWLGTLRLPLSG